MASVLQDWVQDLTFMQQGVLLAAVRGPDGIRKDHIAKMLLRWYRRCVLVCAFDGTVIQNPWDKRGGSFTGPSVPSPGMDGWSFVSAHTDSMTEVVRQYLSCVDELPHHFQLHVMHAAEILGYKHPNASIRRWWATTYEMIVNDAHLLPESQEKMEFRLGDKEKQWRACEEVTARGPV